MLVKFLLYPFNSETDIVHLGVGTGKTRLFMKQDRAWQRNYLISCCSRSSSFFILFISLPQRVLLYINTSIETIQSIYVYVSVSLVCTNNRQIEKQNMKNVFKIPVTGNRTRKNISIIYLVN